MWIRIAVNMELQEVKDDGEGEGEGEGREGR